MRQPSSHRATLPAAGRRARRSGAEALVRLHQDVREISVRVDEQVERRSALLVQLDGEAAALRRRLSAEGGSSPRPAATAQL